jgi:PKD repeat protein
MKTFHLLSITLVALIALITGCEEPAPIASFSASTYSAMVDDLITFTNTSQNATSYNWSFGDGTLSSEQNPTHAYSTAGNFSVQLTATGEGGVSSISNIISIDYPEPVAGFTMDKSTAKIGETIGFTNTSQNANTFLWNFGDGNVSGAVHPTHSYSMTGTFVTTLTATGDGGTAIATGIITIEAAQANIIPGDRMGDFILGNDLEQHFAYINEDQFGWYHEDLGEGVHLHLMEFDTAGIGFFLFTDDVDLYWEDVPVAIYAFDPFVGSTDKGITFGSTLVEVEAAYGTPDEITESGSYSYLGSLGISFWADDATKTYVDVILIEDPSGTKKGSPLNSIPFELMKPGLTGDKSRLLR